MLVQDPWEEQIAQLEPRQGIINQILRSYTLGLIGKSNSPGYQQLMQQAGQKIPEGAISMPWSQEPLQKTADSFAGFFETLDNPNITNAFTQLLKALKLSYGGK